MSLRSQFAEDWNGLRVLEIPVKSVEYLNYYLKDICDEIHSIKSNNINVLTNSETWLNTTIINL